MSNIVKQESRLPSLQMNEPELMEVLESSLYPGAKPASIKMVIDYCKAAGLDPLQKPVHIVSMWNSKASSMRDVIMPGVGLYRTQAARSGCAGVSEPEFGPDVTDTIGGTTITYPAWCRVTATDSRAERGSLLPLEMEACLPGCVWNATPRSLSPLERNTGFWTQA